MVGYNQNENALTLGDDDSLKVGDYELEYSADTDEFQARYGRPIGGERGLHAEIQGPSYTEQSRINDYALSINGRKDTIKTLYKYDGSPVSIGGFYYIEKLFKDSSFIGHFEDKDRRLYIDVDADGMLRFGAGTAVVTTTVEPPVDQWFHLCLTLSGDGTAVLYLDGAEIATDNYEWGGGVTGNPFYLNIRATGGAGLRDSFIGRVDDSIIYSTELSSSAVSDWSNGDIPQTNIVARWNFEYPETPQVAIDSTGDVYPKNSIPRSTSASLVPQGLAESVSEGKALADDGEMYDSIQTAVDNATGWVFVGPGTFNESVTISTSGLTLEGVGYDTLIDGGTTGDAIVVTASNVTVKNLSVQTTSGSGNNYEGIQIGNCNSVKIDNVTVIDSDNVGINIDGGNTVITNSKILSADNGGISIYTSESEHIITSNIIKNTGGNGISGGDTSTDGSDSIISKNIFDSCGRGIRINNSTDCVVVGNRISNSSDDGIEVGGNDNIIANNRISDSGNEDIDDNGTGTVLDDNLTGVSN